MRSVAIVLNGASSAGKTSIAKAIQRLSLIPVLHASLDTFTDMFEWSAIGDENVRRECHRIGVENFHAVIPILASSQFALIVDHVFEQHTWFEACRDALKENEIYLIGVRCPIEILEQREKVREDRRNGLSRWQHERVHEGKPYVLEVDTSRQSPDECAVSIVAHIANKGRG